MSYRRVNRVKVSLQLGRSHPSRILPQPTVSTPKSPTSEDHRNTCGEVVIARAGGGFAFSISRIADLVNGLLRDT
jgi:hypothetical protein